MSNSLQLYADLTTEVALDHIMIGDGDTRVHLDCVGGKYLVCTNSPPVITYEKLSDALRAIANLVEKREE